MLTNFGKFCRRLRIDKGELLVQMADKLGVSSAFLSAVETGKKKPPITWENTLIKLYQLDNASQKELHDSFFEARNAESIDMTDYNDNEKDIMLAFARKINTLGNDRLDKIRKMLSD